MANPFRDMSVFMQGLVAVAIAVVVLLLGVYIPLSPVAQERDAVDKAVQQRSYLEYRSPAVAGLQTALWRTETADGRALEATRHAEDHRARGKRDGRIHSIAAGSG